MRILHWIRSAVVGALRLAVAAFFGLVALFSATLDLGLRIVARLYERFDAKWEALAREARGRRRARGAR